MKTPEDVGYLEAYLKLDRDQKDWLRSKWIAMSKLVSDDSYTPKSDRKWLSDALIELYENAYEEYWEAFAESHNEDVMRDNYENEYYWK